MGTDGGTGEAPRFTVRAVADVERVEAEERWLVDSLWAAEAVGIVGGTPKTGKSWAAVELAISVASGTAAFGRFDVREQGPVLFYPAEDRVTDIRQRIEMLCRSRDLALEGLPLYLLDTDRLHLDNEDDRAALEESLEELRPKLLILDPLVRLHTGSENSTDHVSRVLSYLRDLQRRFGLAVMLTHHLSKKGKGSSVQHGQALRGSGDLHAWGDSNLYLTRLDGGVVELVAEHRQASPLEEPLYYKLHTEGDAGRLEPVERAALEEEAKASDKERLRSVVLTPRPGPRSPRNLPPVEDRVLELLQECGPLPGVALRKALGVRNQKLTDALRALERGGAITRTEGGWSATGVTSERPAGPAVDTNSADGSS